MKILTYTVAFVLLPPLWFLGWDTSFNCPRTNKVLIGFNTNSEIFHTTIFGVTLNEL